MSLKLWLINSLILLLFCSTFEVQAQRKYTRQCPDFMDEIQYVPVTYLGFTKAPVAISYTSWGSNEVDGKYILEIGLLNSSDKTTKTLKLNWYLFDINDWQNTKDVKSFMENEILMKSELPIVEAKEFKPKEKLEIEVELPCEQISPVVGNNRNTKNLILEFVVNEISYSNGTIWKRK